MYMGLVFSQHFIDCWKTEEVDLVCLDFLQSRLLFHSFYSHYMPRRQSIPLSKMFWNWNTSFEYDCWQRSWDCRQSNARANKPVIICLFKFGNKNIGTLSENSWKVTKKYQNDIIVIVILSLYLNLNRFHTLFLCFRRWL